MKSKKRKISGIIGIFSILLLGYFLFNRSVIKAEEQGTDNLTTFSLASDGTGIVAKNIGKTMTDIQSYSGDAAGLKQMILTASGAKAYGMSGGTIVDVSSKIQVSATNGLESVSSNNLQEFRVTLTVPAADAGTSADLTSEIIVYIGTVQKVTTWAELEAAFVSKTVTIIDVQNDMMNTVRPTTGGYNYDIGANRPDYVLLGNGHSLDFYGTSYRWPSGTTVVHKATVDNVSMYGSNYYGPVTMWDYSAYGSSITYRNTNYTGSQVTASFQAELIFEGKNVIKSRATNYTSYDGTVRTNGGMNNQSGLEAHTMTFRDNTDTTIEVENGDGVILGSYMAQYTPVTNIQPAINIGSNATILIRTLGNAGESSAYNTSGGVVYSVINLQRNGKINIGNNSTLTAETAEGTTRVPVRLGYLPALASTWTTSINLGEGSTFNVNANGPIIASQAAVMMQDNAQINVGKNASMKVSSKKMTTGAPVISMGVSSIIDVAQGGNLQIDKDGGTGRVLDLSGYSKFNVHDSGSAKFTSTNETTSTSSMIYGGSWSSFVIGDKAQFEANIKDGTGSRNMLEFGTNAEFKFANAKKIDLDARANTNVNLVNMASGVFKADIQAVSAWTKANAATEAPTYNWTPMYGMSIQYNGITTTSVTGNSVSNSIQQSFVNNYKTENFSRIVYDYIPDVEVTLDEPSDNASLASGQKLTGIANNNAAIQFYLVSDESDSSTDVLLTTATVASPVEGDATKFHVITDNTGKFSYTLPNDVVLKAGQKIKAYAWLNGKDNYDIKTVVDKTAPQGEAVTYNVAVNTATPTPDKFVGNPTDSNPTAQNFVYTFNAETPKATIDEYMKTVGEYTVKVDLADEAGNTTTVTSTLIVNESNEYIKGSDFEVPSKTVKNLDTAGLTAYILEQAKPKAYKIVNGEKTDLTEYIQVSSLGGLSAGNAVQSGEYTITFTVKASDSGLPSDLTTTIQVKVNQSTSIMTIKQVYSGTDTAIYSDLIQKTTVNNTTTYEEDIGADLTTILTDLVTANLLTLNYTGYDAMTVSGYKIYQNDTVIDPKPTTVPDENFTVVFEYTGQLKFKESAETLDFGNVTISSGNSTTPLTSTSGSTISIINTLQNDDWVLKASIPEGIKQTSQSNPAAFIGNILYIDGSGKTVTIGDAATTIEQQGTTDLLSTVNLKTTGGKAGLFLQQGAGNLKGSYSGEIVWTLADTPKSTSP